MWLITSASFIAFNLRRLKAMHSHAKDSVAIEKSSFAPILRRFILFFSRATLYTNAIFAVSVRPSVRPSITSQYCIETAVRIELAYRLLLTYHTLQGNLGMSKTKSTAWTFPNST